MTKILIVPFFLLLGLLNIAYAKYDGYQEGYRIATEDPSADISKSQQTYLKNLGQQKELYEFDKPALMGGYFSLLKYSNSLTAAYLYQNLLTCPNSQQYISLFTQLKEHTPLFSDYLPSKPGNFALKTLQLLGSTSDYLRGIKLPNNANSYVMDEEQENKLLPLLDMQNDAEDASHKIVSGAFGIGRTATDEEVKTITGYLIDRVKKSIARGEDLAVILKNYTLESALKEERTKQNIKHHLAICRIIISASYYLLTHEDENHHTDELLNTISQVMGDLVGPRQKDTFIKQVLQRQPIQDAFKQNDVEIEFLFKEWGIINPKPLVRTGYDYQFQPGYQTLYQRYLTYVDEFDRAITQDMMTHTTDKKTSTAEYSQRELVSNVIDFVIAIKKSDLKNLRICDPTYGVNLMEQDTLDSQSLNLYTFKLDTEQISTELKHHKPNLKSLIWLEQIFSQRMLEDAKYNLKTMRTRIKKFWDNLYEIFLNAYVFAKEQRAEKAFFNNAFPRELHCTDSLTSIVQSWLKGEKEAIGNAPLARYKRKLKIQTEELIHGHNLFIGAIFDNLVVYWLAPKLLEWARANSNKITEQDIESNPKDILMLYPGVEDLSEHFAQEVSDLIVKAAKQRAKLDFNTNHQVFNDFSNYKYYTTTDSDLKVKFLVSSYSFRIELKNIKDIQVMVKTSLRSHDPLSYDYIPLRDYLIQKYEAYFSVSPLGLAL